MHEAGVRLGIATSHFVTVADIVAQVEAQLRSSIEREEGRLFLFRIAEPAASRAIDIQRDEVQRVESAARRAIRDQQRVGRLELIEQCEASMRSVLTEAFDAAQRLRANNFALSVAGAALDAVPRLLTAELTTLWRRNCTARMRLSERLEAAAREEIVLLSRRFASEPSSLPALQQQHQRNLSPFRRATPGSAHWDGFWIGDVLLPLEASLRQAISREEGTRFTAIFHAQFSDTMFPMQRAQVEARERHRRATIFRLGLFGVSRHFDAAGELRESSVPADGAGPPVFSREADLDAMHLRTRLIFSQEDAHRVDIAAVEARAFERDVLMRFRSVCCRLAEGTERDTRIAIRGEWAGLLSLMWVHFEGELRSRALLEAHSFRLRSFEDFMAGRARMLIEREERTAARALFDEMISTSTARLLAELGSAEAASRDEVALWQLSVALEHFEAFEEPLRAHIASTARLRFGSTIWNPAMKERFGLLRNEAEAEERSARQSIVAERQLELATLFSSVYEPQTAVSVIIRPESVNRSAAFCAMAIAVVASCSTSSLRELSTLLRGARRDLLVLLRDELMQRERLTRRDIVVDRLTAAVSVVCPEAETAMRELWLMREDASRRALATRSRSLRHAADRAAMDLREANDRSELRDLELTQRLRFFSECHGGRAVYAQHFFADHNAFGFMIPRVLIPLEAASRRHMVTLPEDLQWGMMVRSEAEQRHAVQRAEVLSQHHRGRGVIVHAMLAAVIDALLTYADAMLLSATTSVARHVPSVPAHRRLQNDATAVTSIESDVQVGSLLMHAAGLLPRDEDRQFRALVEQQRREWLPLATREAEHNERRERSILTVAALVALQHTLLVAAEERRIIISVVDEVTARNKLVTNFALVIAPTAIADEELHLRTALLRRHIAFVDMQRRYECEQSERADRSTLVRHYIELWIAELREREGLLRRDLVADHQSLFSANIAGPMRSGAVRLALNNLEHAERHERLSTVRERAVSLMDALCEFEAASRLVNLVAPGLTRFWLLGISGDFEIAFRRALVAEELGERQRHLWARHRYIGRVLFPLERLLRDESEARARTFADFYFAPVSALMLNVAEDVAAELRTAEARIFEFDITRPFQRRLLQLQRENVELQQRARRRAIEGQRRAEALRFMERAEAVNRTVALDLSEERDRRGLLAWLEAAGRLSLSATAVRIAADILGLFATRRAELLIDRIETREMRQRRALELQTHFLALNHLEGAERLERCAIAVSFIGTLRLRVLEPLEAAARSEIIATRDDYIRRYTMHFRRSLSEAIALDEADARVELATLAIRQQEGYYRQALWALQVAVFGAVFVHQRMADHRRALVSGIYFRGWLHRLEWAERRARKIEFERAAASFAHRVACPFATAFKETHFTAALRQHLRFQTCTILPLREAAVREALERQQQHGLMLFITERGAEEKSRVFAAAAADARNRFGMFIQLYTESISESINLAAEALQRLRALHAEARIEVNFQRMREVAEQTRKVSAVVGKITRAPNAFVSPLKARQQQQQHVTPSVGASPNGAATAAGSPQARTGLPQLMRRGNTLVSVATAISRRSRGPTGGASSSLAVLDTGSPSSSSAAVIAMDAVSGPPPLPPLLRAVNAMRRLDFEADVEGGDSTAPIEDESQPALDDRQNPRHGLKRETVAELEFLMRCQRQDTATARERELRLLAVLMADNARRIVEGIDDAALPSPQRYAPSAAPVVRSLGAAAKAAARLRIAAVTAEEEQRQREEAEAARIAALADPDDEFIDPLSTQGHRLLELLRRRRDEALREAEAEELKAANRKALEAEAEALADATSRRLIAKGSAANILLEASLTAKRSASSGAGGDGEGGEGEGGNSEGSPRTPSTARRGGKLPPLRTALLAAQSVAVLSRDEAAARRRVEDRHQRGAVACRLLLDHAFFAFEYLTSIAATWRRNFSVFEGRLRGALYREEQAAFVTLAATFFEAARDALVGAAEASQRARMKRQLRRALRGAAAADAEEESLRRRLGGAASGTPPSPLSAMMARRATE